MATDLAGGMAGVALLTAPGLGLSELLPSLRRLPPLARLAYSYLLGLATLAGALFALSHVWGIQLRRTSVVAAAAVPLLAGLGARGVRRWRARREAADPGGSRGHGFRARRGVAGEGSAAAGVGNRRKAGRRTSPRRLMLLTLCFAPPALVLCGVLADAAGEPVKDWDGRMTWSALALFLRAERTVDADVLTDDRWYITHPQYPPLLPLAQVAVLDFTAAGRDSYPFRMLYAACFAALLVVVYDGARRHAGGNAAALTVLAAGVTPFLAYGEGGAATTYSDLPLACFYGAALVLLLQDRVRVAGGLAAGLFLAAAVLTKNEGLPLAVLALLLSTRGGAWRLLHLRRPRPRVGTAPRRGSTLLRRAAGRRRLLRTCAAAAPLLLATALLVSWRMDIPNREDEGYLESFNPGAFWPAVVTRLPAVAPVLARQMFNWNHWRAFWWMVPVVLAAGAGTFHRSSSRRLVLAAMAPAAIGWAAYAVHPRPLYLAKVTWERLLLQGSVPLLLVLAGALADILARRARGWRRWRGARP